MRSETIRSDCGAVFLQGLVLYRYVSTSEDLMVGCVALMCGVVSGAHRRGLNETGLAVVPC